MRYVKMLGLAALLAAALSAFAGVGTAAATTLTDGKKNILGAETKIHAASEGKLILKTAVGTVECEVTLEAKTQNEGGAGKQIFASLEQWIFKNCGMANAVTFTTGELQIFGAAGSEGELKNEGLEITIEKSGFHCIYKFTTSTKIGTITGTEKTKKTATIDFSATIPVTGGRSGGFCGMNATWTGSFEVDVPDALDIDA